MDPLSTFKLRSLGTRAFALTDAYGNTLGELRSPGFFSQDMAGHIGGLAITVQSVGFWRRAYQVRVDGAQVGEVRFGSWRVIHLTLGASTLDLARRGVFSSDHLLLAGPGHPLLEVQQAFNWRRFATEYTLTVVGRGMMPDQVHLLALMCGFALRIQRARAAAAAT